MDNFDVNKCESETDVAIYSETCKRRCAIQILDEKDVEGYINNILTLQEWEEQKVTFIRRFFSVIRKYPNSQVLMFFFL